MIWSEKFFNFKHFYYYYNYFYTRIGFSVSSIVDKTAYYHICSIIFLLFLLLLLFIYGNVRFRKCEKMLKSNNY